MKSVITRLATFLQAGAKDLSTIAPAVIFGALSLWTAYVLSHCIYNIYFHPLAKFPGPRLSAATDIIAAFQDVLGKRSKYNVELHARYGGVVRTRPNELSFIGEDAWKDICMHRQGHKQMAKAGQPPGGTPSILHAGDEDHARQRRLLSHAFSERALRDQEDIIQGYVDLLVSNLREDAEGGKVVDMTFTTDLITFDIVSDLSFGEPFGGLRTRTRHPWVTAFFEKAMLRTILIQMFSLKIPILSFLVQRIIVPMAKKRIGPISYTKDKILKRMEQGTTRPDFMSYVLRHNDEKGMSAAEIQETFNLLLIAGSETTATFLAGFPKISTIADDDISLAMAEMKLVLAKILFNFEFELVDEKEDWLEQDTYTFWSKKPLLVKIRDVKGRRKRRKKCDETPEKCQNCMRNDLECLWPSKESQKDRRHLKRKIHALDSTTVDSNKNHVQALALVTSSSPKSTAKHVEFNAIARTDTPLSEVKHKWPSWILPRVEEVSVSPDFTGDHTIAGLGQVLTAPIRTEESCSLDLLSFFLKDFLPSRIHPASHTQFSDFSYVHEMAMSHPPLLYACQACALSAIGTSFKVPECKSGAVQRYSRSINLLRKRIQGGDCEGSEDWLLATVVILTLYENRQPGYNPAASAAHIAAAGQLFRQRARTKMSAVTTGPGCGLPGSQTWSTLVFERVFIEAFLYQCMVMSVQETSLTPLQDVLLRPIFDNYFEMCPVPTSPEAENWPVFGMHYQIIRLFSDLFAAVDPSSTVSNIDSPRDLHQVMAQLEYWKLDTLVNNHESHIMLYISAAKLLGYRHLSRTWHSYGDHSAVQSGQLDQLVQEELSQCLSILSQIQVTKSTFTRYFYWPLAIIDRVVRDTRASNLVEQKLQDVPLIDPAGKKAYEWVAKGFEKRFKITNGIFQKKDTASTQSLGICK
ncbi:hypothetical protein FKW77_008901 [Venturia effusa]|uniref:Zn(2)-C6 fungal-type domain-containing protein n=1 Tax=Venturia effusa TaxID=50376 RepID=A0A517L030_9PEZI|nr:hypothetical protein FKW77_008901 [Venturia effusa]